jgi:hypothetical protein
MRPLTGLAYSATTSPKALRWMPSFCPDVTLAFSLTSNSMNPAWVVSTGIALFPT